MHAVPLVFQLVVVHEQAVWLLTSLDDHGLICLCRSIQNHYQLGKEVLSSLMLVNTGGTSYLLRAFIWSRTTYTRYR